MPIILHIDFNSYFASVEAQANPFLRGTAFAVSGKGGKTDRSVITTASREAKKLGVKTAMGTWEALRIIPNLPIIAGDPRKYADITHRFLKILHKHCDAVEQFSVDEAFADITISAGDKFGALFLAQQIRHEIAQVIGIACTASIGIAPNKMLAKLASESVKPNGITYVSSGEALDFMLTRAIDDVCGIGPRLQQHLESIGVISIRSLRTKSISELINNFGKHTGNFLWNTARGIGDDKIDNDSMNNGAIKSVGHSYTFPRDLLTVDEVKRNLLALCDMVARRLRDQHLAATSITAFARYNGFDETGVSVSFKEATNDGLTIFRSIDKKFCRAIDFNRGVRLLGVTTHKLVSHTPTSLFATDRKQQAVIKALDISTKKYGSHIWHRASTMKTVFLERTSGWHYDIEH